MKTKKLMISAVIFSIAMTIALGNEYVTAEKPIEPVPEPVEKINEDKNPTVNFQEFSNSKINDYKNIAIDHPEIKSLLGDNFKFQDIAYRLDPVVTVFDLTFITEDGSKVLIKFDNGEIIHYEKYESTGKWAWKNGIVNKYYDYSTDVKGIGHNFDTPSSFSSTDSTWNALLTNGVKEGSDLVNDDLCNSADSPDSYWAQAGVQFDDNGIRGGWADTNSNCDPTFFSLSISAGDEITSRIYLDDSVSNKWWMTVDNLDDGFGAYGKTRTITGSTELLKNEPMTGVWWENQYTPNQGWDSDFGSDVVSDWASYKDTGDNNWYLWQGETQDTSICKPTANPTSVVSGAFDSGTRDVTWDVSDIDDDCGAGNH